VLEGSQSETSAQARQTVTFRVMARNARSSSLHFAWTATTGTLGTPQDSGTASEVSWTASSCSSLEAGEITVTVTDEQGVTASKSFGVSLSLMPCVATAMTAGKLHALALLRDGTVWAWGANISGQLGDGTTTLRSTPLPVPGLTGVFAVEAGDDHSLAVRSDGTVWAWGSNTSGQLISVYLGQRACRRSPPHGALE
jgi:hypothetical protein